MHVAAWQPFSLNSLTHCHCVALQRPPLARKPLSQQQDDGYNMHWFLRRLIADWAAQTNRLLHFHHSFSTHLSHSKMSGKENLVKSPRVTLMKMAATECVCVCVC